MCLMDWQLGRLIRSQVDYNSVPAATTITWPSNPQRVGFSFILSTGGTWVIGPDSQQIAVGLFPTVSNGLQFHFTLATHGDLPTRFFAARNNGGVTATILTIQYFLPEEYLQYAMEQLKQKYPIPNYGRGG